MQEYVYYCFSTVRTLSKDSILELFSEADVQVPENWRQIGLQLGLDLKGQLSATDFFNGWNENASTNNKPSWEKLAQALFKMDGLYRTAASKASMKARKNYVENNLLYLLWACRTLEVHVLHIQDDQGMGCNLHVTAT